MKILCLKKDILCVTLLATVTLLTRFILLTNFKTLYFVDCYEYVNRAILISNGEILQPLRGYPFIFILGIIIRFFDGLVDPINSAIIFMIICNVSLISIVYFLSRNFFDTVPAFFVALFASLQTNLIFFSLVPYLEVFAYLIGFSSMYILVSHFSALDLKFIFLSLFLCAISILTRFEMLAVFFIPLMIILLINGSLYKNNRKSIALLIISSSSFILLLYPQFQSYYFNFTRFDPIQRLFMAMSLDILKNAFNSIFNISSNELLNILFKWISLFGFLLILFTKIIPMLIRRQAHHQSKSILKKMIYFKDKARLTILSLSISFLILLIITVVYYSVSYQIIGGKLIIIPARIGARYLIGPQLYLSWLFIYSLYKIDEQILRFVYKKIKISIESKKIKIYINRTPALTSRKLYVFLLTVLIFPFVYNTSMEGLTLSQSASQTMGLYEKTSLWLATNLKEGEVAIVPLKVVFDTLNVDLRNKTIPYKIFWDKAEVSLKADNTKEEYFKVQEQLINFIGENTSVRYVVVDWMDEYCKPILYYSLGVNNELDYLLREVHKESLIIPGQWIPQIRVYEIVHYTTLFAIELSTPPKQFFTLPRDVITQYDSDGVHLQKASSTVGFYLPLNEPIVLPNKSYLTVQIKLDVKDSELMLVLYYDKNRDGFFSGYGIDYIKSATFNQTKLGYAEGQWYTIYCNIPKTDDPIVQIGIKVTGDKNGTVLLRNLIVYIENP
jgi:hypothetical protein